MPKIVGIDLGTTNSLVAIVENGTPRIIAGRDGRSLVPSVIYFDEGGSEITMVTLAVPMFDATSNFFGVATVDLALDRLREMVRLSPPTGMRPPRRSISLARLKSTMPFKLARNSRNALSGSKRAGYPPTPR